jgi:hypothetical protein
VIQPLQGITATTFPLVMEFSWPRTIEDRALAPVPLAVLAVQKMVAGARSHRWSRTGGAPGGASSVRRERPELHGA